MIKRLGLIIPSSNRMVEQEMARFYPRGTLAHVARVRMTGAHRAPLDVLLPRIEEAARTLTDAKCDIISFHCTVTSMSEGDEGEGRILETLRTAGAPRMATTSTAVRAALTALGAGRLAVVTPYDAHKTEEEVAFLEASGHEVCYAKGWDLPNSDAYCDTPAGFWRDRVLAAAHPDVEAYFLSCANIQAMEIIAELEDHLGKPVLTSNQAVIWDGLRQTGWTAMAGPGRLFAI